MSRAWEFLMALKDKRKLAEGSRQEEFEEFLRDQVSKTPPSYCEIYGLHISGRNKFSFFHQFVQRISSVPQQISNRQFYGV